MRRIVLVLMSVSVAWFAATPAAPGFAGGAAAPILLRTIGQQAIAPMYPSGLTVDAARGLIVVADTGNDRVTFYSLASGTRLPGVIGGHGSARGQFRTPRDVAVDSESNIYVADTDNSRIQAFNASGALLWMAGGGTGTCNSCLHSPIGVGWDAVNHQLLVADAGLSVIKAFDANGAWLWTSPSSMGFASPRDATRGPDGRIWVGDYGHHQIKAFDVTPAGVWTTKPALTLGDGKPGGHGSGQLNFPYNVEFSPDGHVAYVADLGNHRIARWDIRTSPPRWLSPFGSLCREPCPEPPGDAGLFADLRRVAVAPSGDVLGADLFGNAIQVFAASGALVRVIEGYHAPAAGFNQVYGVGVASSGTVYAVDRVNQRIERFSATGVFRNEAGSRGVGNAKFSWPEAVSAAPNGKVWVADTRNGRLEVWPASLSTTAAIPAIGTEGGALGQFNYPEGLTVAANGQVWVADTLNNRVEIYSPATGSFKVIGTRGRGNGQFLSPQAVAVTTTAIYVADTGNNRIQKLSLTGAFQAAYSIGLSGPQGIAVSADGTVWVVDTGNSRLVHLTSGLQPLPDGFGGLGSGPMQFDEPHSAVAVGASLYVADTYNDRIQVFGIG
jgi:tripartite motif-containing protein 71